MKIKIENFEGPLDLLLQLIEKEELDITQISLLTVAEQYIAYLDKIEKKEPEMLADFLLIAAKLLYIKSRALLPELELEGEEDSIDLADQLRMYKKFVDASKIIEKKFVDDNFAFSRPEQILKVRVKFEPPKSLTGQKLKGIMARVIKDLDMIIKLPKKSLAKMISIKEKISHIQQLLKDGQLINFSQLLQKVKDKTDVIVSFLGILELSKQGEIRLEQKKMFDEIEIKSINQC